MRSDQSTVYVNAVNNLLTLAKTGKKDENAASFSLVAAAAAAAAAAAFQYFCISVYIF